jgi:NhaA family Na+:H+ antiporter
MSGESRAVRLSRFLSRDTTGGILLLIAAALALVAANTPLRSAYAAIRDFRIGPELLHLDLTIGQWAADGLLRRGARAQARVRRRPTP